MTDLSVTRCLESARAASSPGSVNPPKARPPILRNARRSWIVSTDCPRGLVRTHHYMTRLYCYHNRVGLQLLVAALGKGAAAKAACKKRFERLWFSRYSPNQ